MNPAMGRLAATMQPAAGLAVRAALIVVAAGSIALFEGCASRQTAPVVERPPGALTPAVPVKPAVRAVEARPGTHIVRRGETLYGIALDHGLDYRELAQWNGISDPNVIRVGDALRLSAPASASATAQTGVQVKPITVAGAVEARPLGPEPQPPRQPPQPAKAVKKPDEITISRIEPRNRQLKPEPVAPVAKLDPAPAETPRAGTQGDDPDRVDWSWPVEGKVVATFVEPGNKGVDIAAGLGDPVLASAPGRVVYSGSGLRGYGKLIIIKHNAQYLSAYAHNSQILVKEGQNVTKGQKIGEVGTTDTDSPKLHFEIRRLGKPVDPLKFLPERPS